MTVVRLVTSLTNVRVVKTSQTDIFTGMSSKTSDNKHYNDNNNNDNAVKKQKNKHQYVQTCCGDVSGPP